MPFIVIKGTFHVTGYSPDGDSVRFKAADESNWDLLDGRSVKKNGRDHAQLRFEAIDTLETHYKSEHQPPLYADGATKELLKKLGIKNVVWNNSRTRVTQADDGIEGYILSRKAERYGRPVAFVYSDVTEMADGSQIYLDGKLLKKSINYKMIKAGLAYPTFYDGLFYDLRNILANAASKTRSSKTGLWKADKTNAGFMVSDLSSVTVDNVILPKLFRRLVAHLKNGGAVGHFKETLAKKPERVLIISDSHFTNFDQVVSVENSVVSLTTLPENMVFLS